MDYEKKYKDAVSAIKFLLYKSERGNLTADKYREELESIIPELKESEDERIRMALIECFSGFEKDSSTWGGFKRKDILAWLEKQGEQKVLIPKYRIGDTIRLKGSFAEYTITGIFDGCYHGNGWYIGIEIADKDYELVEQNPAWSEDDEEIKNIVIGAVDLFYDKNICFDNKPKPECLSWLNALKDRVQPQPKEE